MVRNAPAHVSRGHGTVNAASLRIAFVDLLFSWPPNGGADVDLYHTVAGLQDAGHAVQLFAAGYGAASSWGAFDPPQLPFPAKRLEFGTEAPNPKSMAERFRSEIDAWKPDLVFFADGFFLKPVVANALAHYPAIGRYYAYEAACIRDALLFKNDAPCPLNYLRTPGECGPCAVSHLKPQIQQGRLQKWTQEFISTRAYLPSYHSAALRALQAFRAVVVYNALMKEQLSGVNDRVHVIPGGVDVSDFSYSAPTAKGPGERTIILMAGRVEDPMKGLKTLLAAGGMLAQKRTDFEIWATHSDHTSDTAWFKAIGWHAPAELRALYTRSDICVVPSLWEEPFGLVAVEAMASGRPVCASRVGGLQGIVRDGETGFLFARADAADLARCLSLLLDDAESRRRMGEEGRRVAESEYEWKRIIAAHYPPLFESVLS